VALQQGHDRVVAVLLENDLRSKVRLPALHIAAKKDDVKAATLLLHNDHNADLNSKVSDLPHTPSLASVSANNGFIDLLDWRQRRIVPVLQQPD